MNDAARAVMGGVKRFWDRINPTLTTGGSSTVYTLTYSVAPASYATGELFSFIFHTATGATPTMNVNALGARNLRRIGASGWQNVGANDYLTDQAVTARIGTTTIDIITPVAVAGASLPLAGGTLTGDVTLDTNAQILLDDSITAPGAELPLAFDGDRNTGMLRTGADAAALAANGATVLAWGTTGVAVTGTFSATGNLSGANFAGGTYTPTITGVANVASSTAFECQYIRIGNTVYVSGRVNLTLTSGAAVQTQFGVSLPVASNLGAVEDLSGTFGSAIPAASGNIAGGIYADTTNDRAQVDFISAVAATSAYVFHFGYKVI